MTTVAIRKRSTNCATSRPTRSNGASASAFATRFTGGLPTLPWAIRAATWHWLDEAHRASLQNPRLLSDADTGRLSSALPLSRPSHPRPYAHTNRWRAVAYSGPRSMADPPEPTAVDEEFDTWFRWADRIRAIAQTGTCVRDQCRRSDVSSCAEIRERAADCLSRLTSSPRASLQKLFAEETGYPTPKIEVRAVVFQEGRVLLVRERDEALWALPGGWADIGYSPGDAAAKEVFEESGYIVKPQQNIGDAHWSKRPRPPSIHYVYRLFVGCDLIGGEPTESIETDGVGFFARDELPPLCASRSSSWEVARAFYHLDYPDAPADFD